MDLSIKLKEAREKAGYSQKEVSEKLNVSRQSVSRWENGWTYPDVENLIILSDLYNCFLQALFGEKCKIFLENVASPNWRKLQGLGWQLFCQLHSHCRPYLVVIV